MFECFGLFGKVSVFLIESAIIPFGSFSKINKKITFQTYMNV